jgi:hypothetical protein
LDEGDMSDSSDSAFILQAFTQSYDWGKLGSSSKAAQYAKVADPHFHLDEDKPYAEASSFSTSSDHHYSSFCSTRRKDSLY